MRGSAYSGGSSSSCSCSSGSSTSKGIRGRRNILQVVGLVV